MHFILDVSYAHGPLLHMIEHDCPGTSLSLKLIIWQLIDLNILLLFHLVGSLTGCRLDILRTVGDRCGWNWGQGPKHQEYE